MLQDQRKFLTFLFLILFSKIVVQLRSTGYWKHNGKATYDLTVEQKEYSPYFPSHQWEVDDFFGKERLATNVKHEDVSDYLLGKQSMMSLILQEVGNRRQARLIYKGVLGVVWDFKENVQTTDWEPG
jgi:hypothetical protein